MVNQQSIVFMVVSAFFSLLVPVVIFIYYKKKRGVFWKPLLVGIVVFLAFSQLLGNSVNAFVLHQNETTANFFKSNPYLFAVYGSLSSSIFEEVGRFIGFAYLLKKYREWKDGISYGIGHGGVEAILIGGFASLQNIMTANLINTGKFDQMLEVGGKQSEALMGVKQQLIQAPSEVFLLTGFERITVFILQIALSLLVLYAVRHKNLLYLFYAILIHGSVNFIVLISKVLEVHFLITEGVLLIAAVLSIVYMRRSRFHFVG
ncbi:YhfC family intramembrane metalloprotease [Radiobacillus kanasensis]|uniref:YhfC family intramembrane metalloprotease n=1 Tax=Radiobacillus kanasensis TaxID=2844358 RepID=UPI001E37A6B9|nr:YhfC family intramembrane metalloprotease [Radiobacillus kanasensis]UFT99131.1 YhfC family intramembrane metalloprotease [Radiobacillus kanasensis]